MRFRQSQISILAERSIGDDRFRHWLSLDFSTSRLGKWRWYYAASIDCTRSLALWLFIYRVLFSICYHYRQTRPDCANHQDRNKLSHIAEMRIFLSTTSADTVEEAKFNPMFLLLFLSYNIIEFTRKNITRFDRNRHCNLGKTFNAEISEKFNLFTFLDFQVIRKI